MKELFAILLAWLAAFTNSVDYVPPPENRGFAPGEYFTLETENAQPDYRTNSQVTNKLSEKNVCFQSNYIPTRISSDATVTKVGSDDEYYYWWYANDTYTDEDMSGSIIDSPGDQSIIVAPAACTRITSAGTQQNYPMMMELQFNVGSDTYIAHISGMYCWSCDAFRDLPTDSAGAPVVVHTYTDTSHAYSKGHVVGIATADTKIECFKSSDSGMESVPWGEFYGLIQGGN